MFIVIVKADNGLKLATHQSVQQQQVENMYKNI